MMTGPELPRTMLAVVCHGPYDYRLRNHQFLKLSLVKS